MSITGILAEFNPFHNGHEYIIGEIKRQGDSVACAIGSNFSQRGDVAVFSKEIRARAALSAGADIIAEIPAVYTMSTAQSFALAGVFELYNIGCDKIAFGSECGDINALLKTADILMSKSFEDELASLMKSGETFAKSREKAAALCGADISVLRSPNDNLGTEYIIAAKKLGLDISFCAVRRKGALHDEKPSGSFASGSYIRELLKNGEFEKVISYTPDFIHPFLKDENIADIKYIERTVLALLRCKKAEDFKNLPDISEGIENRLFEAVKTSSSLDELYEKVKSKRYPLARVRRLVLSAALGFDSSFFLTSPPYTRILGASHTGLSLLKHAGRLSPVITKPSEIEKLCESAKKLFDFECRASDIYTLAFKKPLFCGSEYTTKFIKK